MTQSPEFLTTTETNLPDYRIMERFGVVRGIAVRYDATEIMPGVSEVLCYGTAMRVVRLKDGSVG